MNSIIVPSSLVLPTPGMELLEAVRIYADQGFIPIPIPVGSKGPKTKGWEDSKPGLDAALDRFDGWRSANIGLVMGGPMRLLAIDVDGGAGRDARIALEAEHGAWPKTLIARSGRMDGGYHWVYRIPDDRDISLFGCRPLVKKAIDTRGPGGQIVVCPSLHPASGESYRWAHVHPIVDAPGWMLDMLSAQPKGKVISLSGRLPSTPDSRREAALDKALGLACGELITATKGSYNDTMVRVGINLLKRVCGADLDPTRYVDALRRATQTAGYYDQACEGRLRWCLDKAIAQPDMDDWRPYRMEAGKAQDREIQRGLTATPITEEWQSICKIDRTSRSGTKILSIEGNLIRILQTHPRFATKLQYNSDTLQIYYDGALIDDNMMSISADINDELSDYDCRFSAEMIQKAVMYVAEARSFSPTADYLNGLTWDGVYRIKDIAPLSLKTTGDKSSDTALITQWMIGAVARALDRGCKMDAMLVLYGQEGMRKSTFFRELFGREFFDNSHLDISNKDCYLNLSFSWGREIQELEDYTRVYSAGKLKALLSTSVDVFRKPYSRCTGPVPRRCVLAGTTNEREFLSDSKGANRRYWVLECQEVIDTDWVALNRSQLWAEAVHMYRRCEYESWNRLPISSVDFAVRIDEHKQSDAWFDMVKLYVDSLPREERSFGFIQSTTLIDVFKYALGVQNVWSVTSHTDSNRRVTAALRRCGFERRLLKTQGKADKRWVRVTE